ncbi:MAG: hypothetical protein GXO78_06700 [Calditrichaeota bacterium]|nr:hypothetical protein [Calditrichota bacterium]
MNGLEQTHRGKLRVVIVDATTADAKADLSLYQLGSHGLFIYDAQDQLLKTIPGKRLKELNIPQLVDSLLQSR